MGYYWILKLDNNQNLAGSTADFFLKLYLYLHRLITVLIRGRSWTNPFMYWPCRPAMSRRWQTRLGSWCREESRRFPAESRHHECVWEWGRHCRTRLLLIKILIWVLNHDHKDAHDKIQQHKSMYLVTSLDAFLSLLVLSQI